MDNVYGNERSLAYDNPPPYSPVRRNGSNDLWDDKKDDGIVVRIARTWTRTATPPKKIARSTSDFLQHKTWPIIRDTTTNHVTPVLSSSTRTIWTFVTDGIWSTIRDYPLKASQFWGLLLLASGIVPFVTYGILVRGWAGTFYHGSFEQKILGCGAALGQPQNATVDGIEAMFVLDWTFGQLSFATVKVIDATWDIAIARGVQGIYWAICYRIFTDVLLRLIERHPASFETFKSISLEGAGLTSSLVLFKQLFRNRSIRTWFLFFYLLLSSFYVLSIPPLLGAMTGYDATSIAWVSIGDAGNIIPTSQLMYKTIILGTHNASFDEPMCDNTNTTVFRDFWYHQQDVTKYCDCQLPNNTVLPYQDWSNYWTRLSYSGHSDEVPYTLEDCKTDFPHNDKVYQSTWGQDSNYSPAENWGKYSCNDTFPVTLSDGKTYSMWDLDVSNGYCFENKYHDWGSLATSTRCLPDTANPSYQWGFSSALMGVLLIINLMWCGSMWLVWQDAMLAELVRSGYRMSPLRAAFVLTEAARRRTGVGVKGLVLRDRKLLRKELKRGRVTKEAVVEKAVFEEASAEDEVERGNWERATIKRRPIASKRSIGFDDV